MCNSKDKVLVQIYTYIYIQNSKNKVLDYICLKTNFKDKVLDGMCIYIYLQGQGPGLHMFINTPQGQSPGLYIYIYVYIVQDLVLGVLKTNIYIYLYIYIHIYIYTGQDFVLGVYL